MQVLDKATLREQLVTARNINKQLEHELSKFQWISGYPDSKVHNKVLGRNDEHVFECEFDNGYWTSLGGEEMTHWMPLPEAPTNSKDK